MKSKEEIEEKIGFELEYKEWETFSNGNDWNNFTSEVIKHRELEPKSYNALKDLLVESLENGDIETANLCESIINATDDKTMKSDSEFMSKKQEVQSEFLDKYILELQEIDIESIDKNKVENLIDTYKMISKFDIVQDIEDKKQQLSEIIQEKIEARLQGLNSDITELKKNLELPENEDKINQLQEEIESIEDVYLEFKVKSEIAKEEKQWEGKERTAFNSPRGEEQIKRDLQSNMLNHRQKRMQEQGKDISDIMKEISEYKAVRIDGRSTDDYYVKKFNGLNQDVAKKTDYLEQKLAFLKEHKEIDGNEERIASVEEQLEKMQDTWIVAQKGYNDINGIINTAQSRMKEIQNRIENNKKELVTIDPMTKAYLQKRAQIERDTKEVARYEKYIEEIKNIGKEIESGKNTFFMGEHHRTRVNAEREEEIAKEQARMKAEQEAKEKAEEQARVKAEQEAKEKAEEQARIKAEQEAKEKAEEQARIKAEQEARARSEEQARIKAEQEAKEKAEEQARIKAEQEAKEKAEEQARIKAEQEAKEKAEEQARIKAEQEAKVKAEEQARMTQQHFEFMEKMQPQVNAQVNQTMQEYWKSWEDRKTTSQKQYEQPQEEKIKPREESIRDEVGDKIDRENNMQMQERKKPEVNLWMNRFSNWYNAIDRVSQNVKAKFIKMKSDIINSISDKLKERTNKRQQQNVQEQDSNER